MKEAHQESLDLLRLYRSSGNADCFAELVHRHAGLAYGTALRITRNHHDAEDIAQECFAKLAENAQSINVASVSGWLYGVSANLSKMRVRTRERRTKRELSAEQPEMTDEAVSWAEVEPHIDAAIRELPDKYRDPIVLHFLDQKSQQEVALTLNISQATVSRYIEKGIDAVRAVLKQRTVSVSAGALIGLLTANAASEAPAALISSLVRIGIAGVGSPAGQAASTPLDRVTQSLLKTPGSKLVLAVTTTILLLIVASLVRSDSTARTEPAPGQNEQREAEPASAEPTAVLSEQQEAPNQTQPVIAGPVDTPTADAEPESEPLDLVIVEGDNDLYWSQEDAGGSFEGVTGDAHWPGNHAILYVTNDIRTRLDMSLKFRDASETDILFALSAGTESSTDGSWPLCISFSKTVVSSEYNIDTSYMKVPFELIEGTGALTAFGDEADSYHTLSISLDRSDSSVSYAIDGVAIGKIRIKGPLAPVTRVRASTATPTKHIRIASRFTDFRVKSSGEHLKTRHHITAEENQSATLVTVAAKDDADVAIDTVIRSDRPTIQYGDRAEMKPDMSVGDRGIRHGLLCFPAITDKLPTDIKIESAVLALFIANPGDDVKLHRMQVEWSEDTVWKFFGLQGPVPGEHFQESAEAVIRGPETAKPLEDAVIVTADVTESVAAWYKGKSNFGWLLVSTGRNGTGITTSEYVQPELRPFVMIRYRKH